MDIEPTRTAIVRKVPASSEHPFRADVNRTGNMPSVSEQFFGYLTDGPLPLPRFDGRPVTMIELRPAPVLASCTITLRFWQREFCFRDVSRAAFDVALERSERSSVAFFGQLSTVSRIPHKEGSISTYAASRLHAVGADDLERAVRDQEASVVVVDNLRELMPRIHWTARPSQLAEADREILRELRRLTAGVGREVEVVLFHFVDPAGVERLLAEGFVDEIQELRL
jgi:hypothetical protein